MPKYTYRDGKLVDDTGLPMLNQEERSRPPQTPRVVGDLPGYTSPVTGEWIDGRRARRYDLEKHGCVDARDLPSPTGGKFRNKKFAEKHGVSHLLEQ
jgi:hypothetical protein